MRGCACRGTAGLAHVSCLAEQAKILCDEAEEDNLDYKVRNERWARWVKCGLCEQNYYGVVCCALGWACWKTYVGRPETEIVRSMAMNVLELGLSDANQHADALIVGEALLSLYQRLGAPEEHIIAMQNNLATSYERLGREEEAVRMRRDAYSGNRKLYGEEHNDTLISANNYALSLIDLQRPQEAKSLMRKLLPVARRALGKDDETTLRMRDYYAVALYKDPNATLDHLREAVTTLEDLERDARRVLGGAHPITTGIEGDLREARLGAALRARETPGSA